MDEVIVCISILVLAIVLLICQLILFLIAKGESQDERNTVRNQTDKQRRVSKDIHKGNR